MSEVRVTRLICGAASPPAGAFPGSGGPVRRGRVRLNVSVFLAELPGHGPILVDAGWGREICPGGEYDRRAALSRLPARLADFWRPETPPEMAPAEQLARRGIRPGDLEAVILTTLEPDHAAGLRELRDARRILIPEMEKYWSCRTVYALRQPRSLWESLDPEHFFFRGRKDGPVDRAAAPLGDEGLIAVSTPGYTEGLCAVEIRSPSGKFALIQSDLALSAAALETGEVPKTGFSREFQRRALRWLAERAADPACAGVFYGHGPAAEPSELVF